jgi:hypothetical protein
MPWCPNCKTEYEDHVTVCADCHVDLVSEEALKTTVNFELLAIIPKPELRDIKEYLAYSKIEPIKEEKNEKGIALYVEAKQHKDALQFLKVYVHDKVSQEEEDFDMPEYDTVDVKSGAKAKDLKSSGFSFSLIGGLLLVFGVLNILEIMTIMRPGMYLYSFVVLGVVFIGIGINSYMKLPDVLEYEAMADSKVDSFIEWFNEKYTKASYIKKKKINLDKYDEGSLYFVIIDKLKADISIAFSDDSEDNDKLINSACEIIYEDVFNEHNNA